MVDGDQEALARQAVHALERVVGSLARDEAALLHHIRLLGEADARALSLKTGLKGSAMSLALERLRHLKSVITLRRKGITLYRAKASEE